MAVGVMSGTSLDGLDVLAAEFPAQSAGGAPFEVRASRTYAYPARLAERLARAHACDVPAWFRLDKEWAEFAAECVLALLEAASIAPRQVAVVGSHGHTVHHQPGDGWTAQVGSGAVLHARTGIPVVSDMRSLDVAFGGQGAPLVPVADARLFPQYGATLNLGGFANVRIARSGLAWDVAPCNTLLNRLAQREGVAYDADGALAAAGTADAALVERLLSHQHHNSSPPKRSLAREFNEEHVYPHFEGNGTCTRDLLATAVSYVAAAVARDCPPNADVLVTGGGAYNSALLAALRAAAPSVRFVVPPPLLVEGKEALCFAYLALLRLDGAPTSDAGVTGAAISSCGGALWGHG